MDSPQEFRDTVDRGDVAFNYGVYFEYKTQSWDNDLTGFTLGGAVRHGRELRAARPQDVLAGPVGQARLSAGGCSRASSSRSSARSTSLADYGKVGSADIRKFGGAGRVTWKGLEGKLRLGLEGGVASGDQWDNTPQGNTHIAFANLLGVCPPA